MISKIQIKTLELWAHGRYFIDQNGDVFGLYSNKGLRTFPHKLHSVPYNGYRKVTLRVPGVGKVSINTHQLIWLVTKGTYPYGMCINHIDGNKLNNAPGNLELVTPKENVHHAIRTGLNQLKGSKVGTAKLKEEDIPKIRELYQTGMRQRDIAGLYGVKQYAIWSILTKRSWKHVA